MERRVSALSCRARVIFSASATVPVIHVSVSCVGSGSLLASASQALFRDTPQWTRTSCVRVRAPRRGGRSRSAQSRRSIGSDAVRGPVCGAVGRESGSVKVDTPRGTPPVCGMLPNGFPRPRCGAMLSALRLHGVRSAPVPAMLIGVPFRYGIAAAPNLTPSSTEPSVHPSRRFLLGVATGLCVRCGGRSSGHRPGTGPRRGHPQRHRRGAMMKPCGFLAGCCGWRTMEAIKRKAPPHFSHRSTCRRPRTSTASGRGRSFASNTVSSTLLPLGVRATILLAWYCAASGLQRGVLTPCSGAVRRPRCVPPSSPCKRQNRCQLEWTQRRFLMGIRHVRPFHEGAGT
ncbi:hypothetical protein TCSYLVIO_001789 [Trypanosoma cruzi]|nr:hypothetical protein TCSYLVIO_001789 [Trypanosoma cruzi]